MTDHTVTLSLRELAALGNGTPALYLSRAAFSTPPRGELEAHRQASLLLHIAAEIRKAERAMTSVMEMERIAGRLSRATDLGGVELEQQRVQRCVASLDAVLRDLDLTKKQRRRLVRKFIAGIGKTTSPHDQK